MPGISTHVLDTARGRPAEGVEAVLEHLDDEGGREIGHGRTDADGRIRDLLGGAPLHPGVYRLTFDTGSYFGGRGEDAFYPEVAIVFAVRDAEQHHHVPLLLSPFGYSTYRGS